VSLLTPHLGPYAGRLCRRLADGSLVPLEEASSAVAHAPVVLPLEGQGGAVSSIASGEIAGYDTRDNIAQMTAKLAANGFSRPEERAREAAKRWDRSERQRRG